MVDVFSCRTPVLSSFLYLVLLSEKSFVVSDSNNCVCLAMLFTYCATS
jgi:hypothetical protein